MVSDEDIKLAVAKAYQNYAREVKGVEKVIPANILILETTANEVICGLKDQPENLPRARVRLESPSRMLVSIHSIRFVWAIKGYSSHQGAKRPKETRWVSAKRIWNGLMVSIRNQERFFYR